jgi:hypothetical protein
MHDVPGTIFVTFLGLSIFTPVAALAARFALKPLIETLGRVRQGGADAALQDRRIALLEAEIQHLSTQLQQVAEVAEFHRQLASPAPAAQPNKLPRA